MLKAIGNILKHHKMTAANVGFGIWAGSDAYQEAKQEGAGTIGAVASGVAEGALPMLLSFPGYLAYEAIANGGEYAMQGATALSAYRRNMARSMSNRGFVNAHFDDTQQAFTMRQAGMAIAERSKYNTQQAMMGNEARFMRK